MMSQCYLMLGANLGDRIQNLIDSVNFIKEEVGTVKAQSSFYESEPWGYVDSNSYFNQAIMVETLLNASDVLKKCLAIEDKLGRVRSSDNYEARTMDIDLLFYNAIVLNTPELIVPHPRILERRFVLEPLCEIASKLEHPVEKKTIQELLIACKDTGWVKKYSI